MISTYSFFCFYQKAIKNAFTLIGSSSVTPCPLYQTATCHLLQYLIYKVQKKAFIHLFPIHYSEALYQRNLTQHGTVVANRGRDEHRNTYPKRFKVLNKAIASTITLLLLKPLKWSILNKLIMVQYVFTIRVFVMQTTLKILIFILQKTHQSVKHLQQTIDIFFKHKPIPKPNDLAQKNGKKIKDLLAELEEKFPNALENLGSTDFPIDYVTHRIPIHPVKEKNVPQHFWDIETTKIFFKKSSTSHCPNGCRIKLELENEVDTNLQTKIIELLERLYNFAILPFNNSE